MSASVSGKTKSKNKRLLIALEFIFAVSVSGFCELLLSFPA